MAACAAFWVPVLHLVANSSFGLPTEKLLGLVILNPWKTGDQESSRIFKSSLLILLLIFSPIFLVIFSYVFTIKGCFMSSNL